MEKPRGPSWGLLVIGTLVLGFGFLGTRGLFEPDEGRYAESAREMLQSGNWLIPTLHRVPHLTKPPLTYWLSATGMRLVGINEWGARLFLAPTFVALSLLLASFGQRLWGTRRGRWAGLVFPTMALPFIAASGLTTDLLLTLGWTGAVFCFWNGWSAGADSPIARRWMLGVWVFLGLAFLTKGPPALLLLPVIAAFHLLLAKTLEQRERPRLVRPAGLLAFALVALPWYVAVSWSSPGLLHYFVVHEAYERIFSAAYHRNSQWYKPFTLYLPMLVLGALPWALLVPRRARPWLGDASLETLRASPRRMLLAAWFGLPLVVFSVSRSRQVLYLLPLFPAMALTITGMLCRSPRAIRDRTMTGIVLGSTVVLLALRLVPVWLPWGKDSRALAEAIRPEVAGRRAEIIVVDQSIHGLDFYLGTPGEIVRTHGSPVPSYWEPQGLDEELDELEMTAYRHLFLVRTRQLDVLQSRLASKPVHCTTHPQGKDHAWVVCDPQPRSDVTRLAVLVDDPGETAQHFLLADRLHELDQYQLLDGVLLVSRGKAEPWLRSWIDVDLGNMLRASIDTPLHEFGPTGLQEVPPGGGRVRCGPTLGDRTCRLVDRGGLRVWLGQSGSAAPVPVDRLGTESERTPWRLLLQPAGATEPAPGYDVILALSPPVGESEPGMDVLLPGASPMLVPWGRSSGGPSVLVLEFSAQRCQVGLWDGPGGVHPLADVSRTPEG
ncbi:MAG TPA: glycosyltransferase family 39 protein [Candidatus Polarisedimenticolaceae bacterium]|nr:glycosyltransferase family 39 protein [Candidatus Polarisedimenticolaceae bacterium]